MPYARKKETMPWHFVPGGKTKSLCSISLGGSKVLYTSEIRKGERFCKNCQILVDWMSAPIRPTYKPPLETDPFAN